MHASLHLFISDVHMHEFIMGLLFGWGVAIPFGPMNLEIMRRNLVVGMSSALSFNAGVCIADLTYLFLLSIGALIILQHAWWLRIINIIGAFILAWFGYSAFKMKSVATSNTFKKDRSLWLQGVQGYLMTLLSPFTILFWTSVGGQIALVAQTNTVSAIALAIGVAIGITSWMLGFNFFLHFTRHKLSLYVIRIFNYLGGSLMIAFAAIGLWRAISL